MDIDSADRALRSKGFYLSSVSKMAPELGYVASSRSLKTHKASDGEGGFGQTPDRAVAALLAVHGVKTAPTLADLEAAIDDLIRVL